jgi:hypothetical protein
MKENMPMKTKTQHARELLNRLPRAHLGFFPTPLQRLDRLSELLGIRLYMKRDDFTGVNLFGGNKVRKLEFLLGKAVADGATLKVDGSATFTGGITFASGAALSIAAPNADTPAVTASAIAFANGAILKLPTAPSKGSYKLLALSSGTFAADALSGVTVSGIAVPYTLSVEGDTISISIENDFLYVENQITASQTIAKDTIVVGKGGFNIEGLSLAENVRFTYDPVATPIYVYAPPRAH